MPSLLYQLSFGWGESRTAVSRTESRLVTAGPQQASHTEIFPFATETSPTERCWSVPLRTQLVGQPSCLRRHLRPQINRMAPPASASTMHPYGAGVRP